MTTTKRTALYTEKQTTRMIRGCERTVTHRYYNGTVDDEGYPLFLDARFDDFPFPSDEFEWRTLGLSIDGSRWSYISDVAEICGPCDGDHAAPRCADSQCWRNDEPLSVQPE